MLPDRPPHGDRDRPPDPREQLPADDDRTLEDYLAMHAAVGHRTRYEILYRLVHGGAASPTELEAAIDVEDSTLHYHLETLLEADLLERHVEPERDEDGHYAHYRGTVFGVVTLREGVDELIGGEWESGELYDTSG
jgi:DNA-binding transcriptional ArsR family regulator